MPAPSLQQLAAKVNETYAAMEYQRPGSQVSGALSSAASFISLGYAQPKIMSVKTPKFHALVSATTDEQLTAALTTLRADAEVKENSAIKNIIDIYEHAFKASKGLYADNTGQEVMALATPAEAAQDAIDNLTNSYNEHFTLVANKAEFLQMTSQFLRAQLRIEKQQAIDLALAATRKAEQEEADKTAVALATLQTEKEKLRHNANSAHEEVILAHDTIATQQLLIGSLDANLARAVSAAEKNAKENAKILEKVEREIARLESEQLNARHQHAQTESFAEERSSQLQNKIFALEKSLGLTKEELRFTKTMRDRFAQEAKQISESDREKSLALRATEHQIETLLVQLKEQKNVTTIREQELATANTALEEYSVRISKELTTNKHLSNENQRLESELTIHQGILAIQQEMQHEAEETYNNTDFAKEIKVAKTVSAHLKEELGKAEALISHLESEQHSLKGTLKPLQEQNSQLRRQVNELTAQVEKMRLATSANAHFTRLNQQQQHSQHQQNKNNDQKHHYARLSKQ